MRLVTRIQMDEGHSIRAVQPYVKAGLLTVLKNSQDPADHAIGSFCPTPKSTVVALESDGLDTPSVGAEGPGGAAGDRIGANPCPKDRRSGYRPAQALAKT
jgi:hypothetical protein